MSDFGDPRLPTPERPAPFSRGLTSGAGKSPQRRWKRATSCESRRLCSSSAIVCRDPAPPTRSHARPCPRREPWPRVPQPDAPSAGRTGRGASQQVSHPGPSARPACKPRCPPPPGASHRPCLANPAASVPYLPAGGCACKSKDRSTCMTYASTPLSGYCRPITKEERVHVHLSCASFQARPEAWKLCDPPFKSGGQGDTGRHYTRVPHIPAPCPNLCLVSARLNFQGVWFLGRISRAFQTWLQETFPSHRPVTSFKRVQA